MSRDRPEHHLTTPSKGLNLAALREANAARLPLFTNAQGAPAHAQPDGSDWALSAWSNATLGELGEAANLVKKIERGDLTLEEARERLADELADVVCYLDLFAARAGVDLSAAVVSKFNAVSARVGAAVALRFNGWSDGTPPVPRCGDVVWHRPSGEHWVVAYADAERDRLAWAGWPDGLAQLSDCVLIWRASARDHREAVALWEQTSAGDFRRAIVVARYADALNAPAEGEP